MIRQKVFRIKPGNFRTVKLRQKKRTILFNITAIILSLICRPHEIRQTSDSAAPFFIY